MRLKNLFLRLVTQDLKQDYSEAKPSHTLHTAAVDRWLDVLEGTQVINTKKGNK